jgi:pimeloyl-ACP methyl ester carboxylesterase
MFPLLILLATLFAPSPASGTERPPVPEPGLHEMTLQLESGKTQRYSLHMPIMRDGNKAPLILALHYGGEVTPYISMGFLKVFALPAFRPMKAIILAPDCPGRGWADPASEKAVIELLDFAMKAWPVDPERVAVTGFSMGGTGAWFMAARHSDRFSAAIPVAGRPVEEPDPSVPHYAIHSRQDRVVALEPAELAIEELRAAGGRAELALISGPTHYQTPRFVMPLTTAADWLEHLWSGADYESWQPGSGDDRNFLESVGRLQRKAKVEVKAKPEADKKEKQDH